MDQLQQISDLFREIKEKPYEKLKYLNLIDILRSNQDLMRDELRQTRVSMEGLFHLAEQEWSQWLSDELSHSETWIETFQLRFRDNPSCSSLWLEFLTNPLIQLRDDFLLLLQKAIYLVTYDIQENHLVFHAAIKYYQEKVPEQLKELMLSLLAKPSSLLDDTLSLYSSYISNTLSSDYEQEMLHANGIYRKTKTFLDFIEVYEVRALHEHHKPQFWIEYLTLKGHRLLKESPVILGIFERAVREVDNADFIPVWETVISLLYELNAPPPQIKSLLSRFVKRYPDSCLSWALYLRNLEPHESELFSEARERILVSKIVPNKDIAYEDKKKLIMSYVFVISKLGSYQNFVRDLEYYFNYALKQNDMHNTVERLIVQFYELKGDSTKALELALKLSHDKAHGKKTDIWLFRFLLEAKYNSTKGIFKFLKECLLLSPQMISGEKLVQEVELYTMLHSDSHSIAQISKLIQKTMSNIAHNRLEIGESRSKQQKRALPIDDDDEEMRDLQGNDVGADKRSKTVETKSRDREHLTLLVKNLPVTITEQQLQTFFKGCEPINNISIVEESNNDTKQASIEFGTTQAMLALMTKNFKKIEGHEIKIEQAFNTTVWVTNFPPKADSQWLEDQFGKFGKIISVRLPSLKTNASRRFCYIEYASSEDASHLVQLLDDETVEGYKLVVKISNPELKKQRSGLTEEGRELYICKLDFYKTNAEKVKEIFGKYGEIERVNLPLSRQNSKMGKLHDGYGFVVFSKLSDAESAAERLNGVECDGRIIEVSVAQTRKAKTRAVIQTSEDKSAPIPRETILAKTLVVTNLPETARVQQLQDLFSKIGPVRKVDLNTEKNTAIVEYEKVADAGLALMKLTDEKIDGHVLKIESRASKEERRKPKTLDAPITMNRRQRRALLQQKAKEELPKEELPKDIEMSEEKPKGNLTNNDFRAMLLGKK